MAKRVNNYTRTEDRLDFKKTDNEESVLDYLESYGKLQNKKVLQPSKVNMRCIPYYDIIQELNEKIKNDNLSPDVIASMKKMKSLYQGKIINLVSIIISSVIKGFHTLYPLYYNDVFTECVLDILIKIERNKWDRTKSAFHSYCYETSY